MTKDYIDETRIFIDILKFEKENLNFLLDKLDVIFNRFSLDVNDSNNNKKTDSGIKILDLFVFFLVELEQNLENNNNIINKKIFQIVSDKKNYASVLSILVMNLCKYILSYRKLYIYNLTTSANVLLRTIIELLELLIAILYDAKLFDIYLEYTKLLLEDGNGKEAKTLWYKYLKPAKIKKVLKKLQDEKCCNVDINNKREIHYNILSKNIHNEFLALCPQEEDAIEALKILLVNCYLFLLQVNYLLYYDYKIKFINTTEMHDYDLHVKVFSLLFRKYYFTEK